MEEYKIKEVKSIKLTSPTGQVVEVPIHTYSPNWIEQSDDISLIRSIITGLLEAFCTDMSLLVRLSEPLYMLVVLLERRKYGQQQQARERFRAEMCGESSETEPRPSGKKNRKD